MYVVRKTGYVVGTPHNPPDEDSQQVYKVTKYGRVLTLREENQTHKGIGVVIYGLGGQSYYRIIIENDARTCNLCREKDSTVYSTDRAVIGVTLPPFHPNCRCTVEGFSEDEFGEWWPKKPVDERYLGNPGEIIRTNSGRYDRDTKIGADGRATMERHYTDHVLPKQHSNPHDHVVNWSPKGHPFLGRPINYWDGNVPTFKTMKGMYNMGRIIGVNSLEDNAFTSIADFKHCMKCGGEVQFTYNGKDYGTFPFLRQTPESHDQFYIWQTGNDDSEAWYDTTDELLEYIIEGKKLREIITQVEVFDRTI